MSNEPNPPKPTTLRDRGILLWNDGIDQDASKAIIPWILESGFVTKPHYDHLTLIINSPGGHVNDAFAILDIMKGSPLPVHTVGLGQIASCGLIIFMGGARGHRILTPNTCILSHQYSWGTRGKEHELIAVQKEFDLTSQRIMNHYKEHTGLKEKVIREKLLPPHDCWLSAEEALELNLCDEIRYM